MYWSISSTGRLNGLPDEAFAANWAKIYPDDIVFVADLAPPSENTQAEQAEIEGK